MNDRTDRPTPIERHGAPDCLVEWGLAWLARPIGGRSDQACAEEIEEICLVMAQMRHRDPRLMNIERARWVQQVTQRLCRHGVGMRGYDVAVHTELERRMLAALLTYHSWRESVAPFTRPWSHTGPSDGGEVAR